MKNKNTTIVVDAGDFPFTLDFPNRPLQTGNMSIQGMEKKCALKLMTLDSFVENMSDKTRFQWEMERLAALSFGAVLVEGDWEKITRHHYTSNIRPEFVIAKMLSLSIKYGIPVGPVSDAQTTACNVLNEYANGDKPTLNFSRPPLLPYQFVSSNRHSLSGLQDVILLERLCPTTIQMMKSQKLGVEPYIVNKIAELPFYGVWFQNEDRELNTVAIEAELKGLSKAHGFTLVVDSDRDQGLNRGLKDLYSKLLKHLNMD